jgi:BASS family bile acid:Na+ symporter
VTEVLLLAIKLSVAAIIFAIGLGSTAGDVTYLWRRPGQLVRSLLAMYVVVPLAVYWLAKALALPGPVRLAIFVLAISAGAPLLPRKLANLGREGYVFSLVVTSSLLAVVTVPAWMELLGWVLGRESSLDSWAVARLIAKAFLAPLAAGMVLRRLLPKIAEKLSGRIFGAAGAVLAIAALTLLVLGRRLLFEVGWVALLALAGTAVVALAIGHVMGGPDPRDRKALAVSCVTRHVGIAMLAVSTAQGTQTTALVLVYLVAAAIVTVPYVKWGQGTKGGATAS